MQLRVRDLCDKAVVAASGLGNCGLANQEGLVSQLGKITKECILIRDATLCFNQTRMVPESI